MEITSMTLADLELMKDTLYSDFDNFWSYNVLKQELENEKTKYIIAKENNTDYDKKEVKNILEIRELLLKQEKEIDELLNRQKDK